MISAQRKRVYIGCFSFRRREDEPEGVKEAEGAFQIVVEAFDRDDALGRCRARLDELAESDEPPGPLLVFLDALVEPSCDDLTRGLLFNRVDVNDEGQVAMNPLPEQGERGTNVYADIDFPELVTEKTEGPNEEYTTRPFWSGVESFNKKWKLYWCETEDHDEDWFVVARDSVEASKFYEDEEGYDEDDARAEFVCVLPPSEQNGEVPGWPDRGTLEACGAEFLPNSPQDGGNEMRANLGSGSHVVRLRGRTFAEGDLVGNTFRRMGKTTVS